MYYIIIYTKPAVYYPLSVSGPEKGPRNRQFDFGLADINIHFVILHRYWVLCVHKINIYHHRHPYPCPFRPTDFPRCLPTKLPLLRYGPFTVTYNTHFYFPAHCWKCWGAPTTYWDAISMIQPVAAPERTFLEQS